MLKYLHPVFVALSALVLCMLATGCCEQKEPVENENPVAGSSQETQNPGGTQDKEIPGFTFLKEETFACGETEKIEKAVRVFLHDSTGLEFVLIEGGAFTMGMPKGVRLPQPAEAPFHEVTVPSFLICRTELPQSAWDKITIDSNDVKWTDEREWRDSDHPIEGVSWFDAVAWCEAAGLRLPSEAEWEYACRAGTATEYCYGDGTGGEEDDTVMDEYGWIDVNSGNRTRGVALKKPNAFGLYDVHGNVWEWCQDVFQDWYDGTPTDGSAHVGDDENRVFRGGGFSRRAKYAKSGLRYRCPATERDKFIGFRPACSLPE